MDPRMTRYRNWRNRLAAHLSEVSRLPFKPGEHDCMLFAAGCVEAMTGVDLALPFRGAYDTLEGGMAKLKKAGFKDHIDMIASLFPDECNRLSARAGDLAIMPGDLMASVGIVQGARVYVITEQHGIQLADLIHAERCFHV